MKEFISAIIIAILLTCGVVFTDYPEKFFRHHMECDGSIGGGCACTENSKGLLCK